MTVDHIIARAVLLSVPLWATVADATAGDLPERWKRAELSVGSYLSTFSSDLRVDSNSTGRGTNIDLEDVLDVENDLVTFRADGYWRFFDRHRLELSYYDISRDGRQTLDQQIQFRDQVFDVGATVSSEIDFQVYKASYAYSIVQNTQWDAALALGVEGIELQAKLRGDTLNLGSGQVETAQTFAPLPIVGGRLWYAFADDWTARLNADFFALTVDQYKGSLIDAEAALDYDITDWLGVSLGYNYVNIDIDKTGGRFDASIRYEYSAVLFAARLFLN